MFKKVDRSHLKVVKKGFPQKTISDDVLPEGVLPEVGTSAPESVKPGAGHSINWNNLKKLIDTRDQMHVMFYVMDNKSNPEYFDIGYWRGNLDKIMDVICAVINEAKPLPEPKKHIARR